jgi:hypothetical protein
MNFYTLLFETGSRVKLGLKHNIENWLFYITGAHRISSYPEVFDNKVSLKFKSLASFALKVICHGLIYQLDLLMILPAKYLSTEFQVGGISHTQVFFYHIE